MSCDHKKKGRLYGPFSASDAPYRVVCNDCLEHLAWGSKGETRAEPKSVTADNRMDSRELVLRIKNEKFAKGFETDFMTGMVERAEKYTDLRVTEKQQAVLDRFQFKFFGEKAPESKSVDVDPTDIPF